MTVLTSDQLHQAYQWGQFSHAIQTRLYEHYCHFTQDGNERLAISDIQSASDVLSWARQGARLDTLLSEHTMYFGQDSTNDILTMIDLLTSDTNTSSTSEQPLVE